MFGGDFDVAIAQGKIRASAIESLEKSSSAGAHGRLTQHAFSRPLGLAPAPEGREHKSRLHFSIAQQRRGPATKSPKSWPAIARKLAARTAPW